MKKLVVSLLSFSIILSVAGCDSGRKSTGRTSRATKTTTSAEVEPTTEETTTTTSKETHDTEESDYPEYTLPEVTLQQEQHYIQSTDATMLSFTTDGIQKAYGMTDETSEEKRPKFVRLSADTIKITDPGYEKLQAAIDAILSPRLKKLEKDYKEAVEDMKERSKKEAHQIFSTLVEEKIRVFRADSEVFSFAILTAPIGDDATLCQTYNFNSKTGEQLEISDLITDKEDFSNYLNTQFVDQGYALFAPVGQTLFENGQLPLVVTYDGFMVPLGKEIPDQNYFDDHASSMYFDYIKVPVVNNPDLFNMDYFRTIPESCALFLDNNGELTWDFNGDGKTDILKLFTTSQEDDEYLTQSIDAVLMTSQSERLVISMSDLELSVYNYAYVLKNGQYWYLFITLDSDVSLLGPTTEIFGLDMASMTPDGAESFIGAMDYDNALNTMQPSHVDIRHLELYSMDHLPGTFMCLKKTGKLDSSCKFIPDKEEEIYEGFATGVVTCAEIKGKKVDADGKELGDFTIPKDTACALVESTGFRGEGLYIILETLNEDASKNVFVKIPATHKNYQTQLNDTDIHELFYFILMGD